MSCLSGIPDTAAAEVFFGRFSRLPRPVIFPRQATDLSIGYAILFAEKAEEARSEYRKRSFKRKEKTAFFDDLASG
ncbi:MAG: hypothetical protein NTV68_14285 [Methanomicrobiales archaeon]|nr:hypothetical protein [Methanomicrobiales archaeon]